MHMFREVEVVFWAALNTKEDIVNIIDKFKKKNASK